jgi:protoporphyrin/coproporphyrin ferrochelatase
VKTNGERETTGVLLLNLGGPDSLKAVRPFLFNLFSDREIIRLGPSFMQKPIACLIAATRGGKTQDCYKLIGGRSPILEITSAQARTLEGVLNSSQLTMNGSRRFRVYIAMRYWHPLIEQVMPKINGDGIRRLIVLSLYPQYSIATTGSSVSRLMTVAARYPVEMVTIPSWFDNPIYIDSVVEKIKAGMRMMPDARILFSAHSLPVRFIEEGDPYLEHIKGTIREITRRIDIPWDLSFQSKSGPVKWLEPSTEKMIHDLARRGIKNVLAVPISFVSDHIETLYEIDILYRNMAASLGIRLERTESLNTSSLFISAMEDVVLKTLKEAGWV